MNPSGYTRTVKFTEYIAAHRRQGAVERQKAALRATQARNVAGDVTVLLVQAFGATKVVLFGSLTCANFGAQSDIDIAVAGIEPGRFFAAAAAAQRLGESIDVDLVPFESAGEFLREQIEREGFALYGD